MQRKCLFTHSFNSFTQPTISLCSSKTYDLNIVILYHLSTCILSTLYLADFHTCSEQKYPLNILNLYTNLTKFTILYQLNGTFYLKQLTIILITH